MKKLLIGNWHHLIALVWTVLIVVATQYDYDSRMELVETFARIEAQTNIQKDFAFRSWVTAHGGVYVPATESTPPNPYLQHLPERDIVTKSGKQLTLMNPAYVMRQVMEHYTELYGVRGKLTSLKLMNPVNEPDSCERSMLERFEAGETELAEVCNAGRGGRHLAVMRSFTTTEGCLKCHAVQGYKVGDVRGGLIVTIPLDKYERIQFDEFLENAAILAVIWIIGIAGIYISSGIIRRAMARLLESRAEQGRLEQQMIHSYKLATIGTLAAEVAHEFNNALSVINIMSLSSSADKLTGAELESNLRIIRDQVQRGKMLVSSMTGIVRKTPPHRVELEVSSALDEVLALEETQRKRESITLERSYADSCIIIADKGELQQVMLNLVHNARDAMKSKGGGKLSISTRCIDSMVEIVVADTGEGIDPAHLSRLFEPFYSTKAAEGKGTGLGLSITKRIVESYGGTISAASERGKGTVFVLRFPSATRNTSSNDK